MRVLQRRSLQVLLDKAMSYVVRWTRLSIPIDHLTEQFMSAIAKLGTDLLRAIYMKMDIHHQKGQLGENLR